MDFVHLHSHSVYSILDSCNNIGDYVRKVKSLGMSACALTDHGAMYGTIEFYKTCKKENVKPILGFEAYVAPHSRTEKDPNERYYHLVLLAENDEGYRNIQRICSQGFIDGLYYGKPRVDLETLRKWNKGVIALSGCVAGRIPKYILSGEYDHAKEYALELRDIFGKDNFFLEIQDHGDRDEQQVAQELIRMSAETGIPLAATNDCHYTEKEDADAHGFLLLLRDQKTISSPPSAYGNGQLYVKSADEMYELFKYVPEAIENTVKIAERCNVEIKFHETKMPKAPVPEGKTAWEHLNDLCEQGFRERYSPDDIAAKNQLRYELETMRNMGFVEYFIIVAEYCNWSRANGVSVGPGRGSAAGSIAAYCLGITNLEPIEYKLVFERFLNPERVSNPDIDVDFSDATRYKTIEHVRELYGEENVGQIITFTCMSARSAINRVGKCYEYSYGYCNKLASFVPKDPYITLAKALEQSQELKEAYENDTDAKTIIDMALKLEGVPFTTGKHAAGVIISDRPVEEYLPIARTKDGDIVSQYNMIEVEELGLLKMDFLGLKTLSVIDYALQNIKNTTGIEIDINNIPLDDEKVFDFISRGQTTGIFQIESPGMTKFMKQLKPTNIEDIVAGVALFRPGPMDFIPQYVESKHNPEKIHYLCPELEPILKDTYGCIVYQEQVMQIFQQLAGYSLGGADNVRRAISKKHKDEIEENREIFIHGGEIMAGTKKVVVKGCVNNGIKEDVANAIYDSIEAFASYAFNRAHAACYAILTYQTAYLKCHYPAEYMAAIMTVFMNNADKFSNYMGACKREGIKLLAPDINISTDQCLPENNGVRLALNAPKGVGLPPVKEVVSWRKSHGAIKNIGTFFNLCPELGIDKSSVSSLIDAGALDTFGFPRRALKNSFERIMANKAKDYKKSIPGQLDLFSYMNEDMPIDIPKAKEYSNYTKLINEKEVLGTYISGHPFDAYSEFCRELYPVTVADVVNPDNYRELWKGFKICGMITNIRKTYTKNGDAMAFLTLEDTTGAIKVIVFPRVYKDVCEFLKEDKVICIEEGELGDKSPSEGEEQTIIAQEIRTINEAEFLLWLRVDNEDILNSCLKKVDKVAQTEPGMGEIRIYISATKECKRYRDKVSLTAVEKFETVFGKDNVMVKKAV